MSLNYLGTLLSSSTWPIGETIAMVIDSSTKQTTTTTTTTSNARSVKGSPHATLADHISMQFSAMPRMLLAAYIVSRFLGDWRTYAKDLAWNWIAPILLRDVLLAMFVGTIGDFLLLSDLSPFKHSMAIHKYSESYPLFFTSRGTAPIIRDIFWSIISACIAGLFEAYMLHLYAIGYFISTAKNDLWYNHIPTLILCITWFYTQNIQFYTMHRLIHRWGTKTIPDIGAFLYKHVHSLHHQSKNPTCFSGIAMHPFESFLYLSYAFFPCFFGAHPIAFIYIKLNLISAAMLGHSGFEYPSQGSQPHWLHHQLVDVNYAENIIPLDLLFGTFAANEDEANEQRMKRFGMNIKKQTKKEM
jgi:sterol desaturase/sphingolipid hydroxylase (fatty acid hydroxylase superfamily)